VHAFANAITEAITQAEKNIPQRISAEVERMLKNSPSANSEGHNNSSVD
jgi:hypothetical protein